MEVTYSQLVSIPLGTINTLDRLHDQLQPHIVSIPLGTINTAEANAQKAVAEVSIPLGTINTTINQLSFHDNIVSIPLGTINTRVINNQCPSKSFQFH